ncbi:MAG: tetratricopeptide repeat protein [Bdellovibrionota bacterium]
MRSPNLLKKKMLPVLLIPFFLLPLMIISDAQTTQAAPRKTMVRKTGLISEHAHRKLKRIHDLLSNKDYDSALDILQKLYKTSSERPFEQAQALQTLGYLYAQKEEYAASIQYFEKALALEQLPVATTLSTMHTVAQLYVATQKYNKALKMLLDWFDYKENPSPQAYILLGTIYGELKQYKRAIEPVQHAIDISKDPKEQWLQYLLALYYDLERFQEASGVLQTLISKFPDNPVYWKQLSGIYLNLDEPDEALSVMKLAYKKGFITAATDLKNLTILLLDQGLPYQAGNIIEKALTDKKVPSSEKNWVLAANCWITAKEYEKAITSYEKAGNLAKTGENFVKQGQLYSELEDWQGAYNALAKGLAKGKLKDSGQALLMMGIVKYHLQDSKGAVEAFTQAEKHLKTRKQAKVWLAYFKDAKQDSVGF